MRTKTPEYRLNLDVLRHRQATIPANNPIQGAISQAIKDLIENKDDAVDRTDQIIKSTANIYSTTTREKAISDNIRLCEEKLEMLLDEITKVNREITFWRQKYNNLQNE